MTQLKAGLDYALHRVHHGESDLVYQLVRLAERHSGDHEVHHVALDLAGWSRDNLAALADAAGHYDVRLSADPDRPGPVRHALDALESKTPGKLPSMLLLEDLHDLYLRASETSLAWEMLAQHAQAKREPDLLAVTESCHPQTLRQIRWANSMIKILSPQALASLDA